MGGGGRSNNNRRPGFSIRRTRAPCIPATPSTTTTTQAAQCAAIFPNGFDYPAILIKDGGNQTARFVVAQQVLADLLRRDGTEPAAAAADELKTGVTLVRPDIATDPALNPFHTRHPGTKPNDYLEKQEPNDAD